MQICDQSTTHSSSETSAIERAARPDAAQSRKQPLSRRRCDFGDGVVRQPGDAALAVEQGALHGPPRLGGGRGGVLRSVNSAPKEALLVLVAQGNVLTAELLRLSGGLPAALRDGRSRFAPVLPDFAYLKDAAAAERRIEASPALAAMDDEFREKHMAHLEALYRLYERIVAYHGQLTAFFRRLREGAYIQATVESMLLGPEGKQLMVEAVALLGGLLLLLDRRVPGPARERSVVAYFRAKGGAQAVGPSINSVIALCAGTGFTASARWLPSGYPENYLARLPVPPDVIAALLSRLRSDDIYSQILHYPSPEHRSTALAQQAGQLYVLMFYAPEVLHNDGALMRVLVDKHFVDNWVVAWAPGASADLAWEWANYKAARTALGAVATPGRASQMAADHAAAIPVLSRQLSSLLVEGLVREEYVLQNTEEVLDCLRACNVAARWLMLHATGRHPRLAPAVAERMPRPATVVSFVMDTALLEFEVKRVYSGLLDTREERWAQARSGVADTLQELSEFYSASGPLSRRLADDSLAHWFAHLADQVEHLVLTPDAGRRVRSLAGALDEAEGHHAVEASAQAMQHLAAARAGLATMVRIDHVREEVLATLGAVSDFSFSWGLMDTYTAALQAQVRSDPRAVLKLRCVFLKLRSGLELPLLRVAQAGDAAAAPLQRYYSSALLAYVRKVLEVVPATVMELVDRVVALQAGGLLPPEGRLPAADLKAHAQLPARAEAAALTRRIAALAQGILAMERTFMGVIEIDPVQLLEDGLRAGIARRITAALATHLQFPQHRGPPLAVGSEKQELASPSLLSVFSGGGGGGSTEEIPGRGELQRQLQKLGSALSSFRTGFESVQDYAAVRGLMLWHQEFAAIVRGVQERESAASFPRPAAARPGAAEPGRSPRHRLTAKGALPATFLGRVASQLLRLSDPGRTTYHAATSSWTDASGAETLDLATFRAAARAFGVPGLAALDHLLGLRMQQGLGRVLADAAAGLQQMAGARAALDDFSRSALSGAEASDVMSDGSGAGSSHGGGGGNAAEAAAKAATGRLQRLLEGLAAGLAAIGQAALLRRRLALELRLLSALEASETAADASEALGGAAASAASAALAGTQPPAPPPPLLEGDFLTMLTDMLQRAGLEKPNEKVYIRPKPAPALPPLLFLAVRALLPAYRLEAAASCFLERRPGRAAPDPAALAAGTAALLQQFPAAYLQATLQHFGAALRGHVAAATGAAAAGLAAAGVEVGLAPEAGLLAAFLRQLEAAGGVPPGRLPLHVPGLVLEAQFLVAM